MAELSSMPRYHFNIYDGHAVPDIDGVELADLQIARLEAIRLSAAVVRDNAEKLDLDEGWHMDVTDKDGLVLYRIDFSVMGMGAPQQRG